MNQTCPFCDAAQRVGRAIANAGAPDGITYITEDDLTGQGYNFVAHWKLHVIARYRDDGVTLDWNRSEDPEPVIRATKSKFGASPARSSRYPHAVGTARADIGEDL